MRVASAFADLSCWAHRSSLIVNLGLSTTTLAADVGKARVKFDEHSRTLYLVRLPVPPVIQLVHSTLVYLQESAIGKQLTVASNIASSGSLPGVPLVEELRSPTSNLESPLPHRSRDVPRSAPLRFWRVHKLLGLPAKRRFQGLVKGLGSGLTARQHAPVSPSFRQRL